MSASTTAPELPTIVELKPRGQFLPALVTCSALDRRRRQLPSATLALHERHELRRARYIRADGRETEVWFDNTSYTLLDEIAPTHLPLARERYRISAEQITITGRVTLQSYTVNGVAVYLCPACANKTPGKAKWSGELINGYCDGCGVGPSHPHFPATTERHQPTPPCSTCGGDGSLCVDCNPIPATEAAELAIEARAVLLDEQAARDAEAEQLIAEMRELDARASDLERRAGEAVRQREHEHGRMLRAEAWALADRYYQRWARLGVLGYAVTHSLELERLPSPAPAFDGCVRCAVQAALTIRFSGGDLVRLCAGCFERHYQQNEYLAVAWEVVEGIPATGCAPSAPCAGSRVEVAFGPDQGQTGTVHRALDHTGYIAVRLDRPGPWAEHLYLPEEIRPSLVPPPQERPWANDAAYAVLGE